MIPNLLPLIPDHRTYVEPFAGGASLLFAKPRPENLSGSQYREVLNDINNQIITLYRVCQNQKDEFLHLIQHTLHSESEHRKAKQICQTEWNSTDPLWQAWAVYLNCNQSFANKMNSSWARSKHNLGNEWNNKTLRLPELLDRMATICLSNTDALKVIDQFDSDTTLFYCDPPYVGTDQGHYKGYTLSDLQALIDKLDTIRGQFLLSTYLVEGAVIPGGWECLEFDAVMSARNYRSEQQKNIKSRTRTELVYRKPIKR